MKVESKSLVLCLASIVKHPVAADSRQCSLELDLLSVIAKIVKMKKEEVRKHKHGKKERRNAYHNYDL